MSLQRKIARGIVFPALMGVGYDRILRNRSRNWFLNVMYHGVVEKDSTFFSPRHIIKEQFEQQLRYFRREFDIVSVPEMFELVASGKKPKRKTITVTFDDGFQNNLKTALPILEKYQIPTTFFVVGFCVDNKAPHTLWSELVACVNHFQKGREIEFGGRKFLNLREVGSGEHLYDVVKKLDFDTREEMLADFRIRFQIDQNLGKLPEEIWKLMTPEELKSLSSSPLVLIGSHGDLHYNLGNIKKENAEVELIQSKRKLEQLVGKPVDMIAYPDGNYSEVVKDLAEKVGYRYQLAVDYRLPSDPKDSRILSRHGISSTTNFASNMLTLSKAFGKRGF